MAENKMEGISQIKDITLKIDFHENRISMHRSAIKKLHSYLGESPRFQSWDEALT